jgi:hypothetical protein
MGDRMCVQKPVGYEGEPYPSQYSTRSEVIVILLYDLGEDLAMISRVPLSVHAENKHHQYVNLSRLPNAYSGTFTLSDASSNLEHSAVNPPCPVTEQPCDDISHLGTSA